MIELVISCFFSAGIGFAVNRFVLKKRIRGQRLLAVTLATSRAAFYAPSLIHIGHGAYIPGPFLITVYYSFRESGPELDLFVFLIPSIVLVVSLVMSWLTARHVQPHVPGRAPKTARP
ncbi:MAG TPA: hypothetical protein VKA50_06110 [Gammaproteobacteria bacterium]|nr:hypothetical protein [Gammaproteobacteria bacterium]